MVIISEFDVDLFRTDVIVPWNLHWVEFASFFLLSRLLLHREWDSTCPSSTPISLKLDLIMYDSGTAWVASQALYEYVIFDALGLRNKLVSLCEVLRDVTCWFINDGHGNIALGLQWWFTIFKNVSCSLCSSIITDTTALILCRSMISASVE
jgi:hypothetical protein